MRMAKETQTFTILARTPPYGSNRSSLLLDIALTSSIFEHNTNYEFMGDGVFQLLKDQDADQIKSCKLATNTSFLHGATFDKYDLRKTYQTWNGPLNAYRSN